MPSLLEILKEYLDAINSVSTIDVINAGSTIVVAVATLVLACLTGSYARSTRQILDTYDKPEVLIYLFPSESNAHCINLCIQNIGTGFASDIILSGDLSFESPFNLLRRNYYSPQGTRLEEISIFRNGIDYLPPGRKIEMSLFYTDRIDDLSTDTLSLTADYTDSRGKSYLMDFNLKFNQWENFSQSVSPNSSAAQSLGKIAQDIERVLRQ